MKIIFMGTPEFSVPVLDILCKNHQVLCVYTQTPKEAGRGKKVTYSPIHQYANEQGIEVRTPKSLRNEEQQQKLKELGGDIIIVAAYGLILPLPVLEACPKGCINVHASLLPRWRGAAPIQRAIEFGDEKSGITIMNMEEGLDTGDMLLKGEVAITKDTTGGSLHDEMSALGGKLIKEFLDNIDNINPQKQDDSLTCYAKKIDKSESKIDFANDAIYLEQKIRAFNPYPAMFFEFAGERFKILKADVVSLDKPLKAGQFHQENQKLFIGTNTEALQILQIQREGKKAMPTEDLLRGFSFV